jgi:uncharacterized protein
MIIRWFILIYAIPMLLSSEQIRTSNRIVGYSDREIRLADATVHTSSLLTHDTRHALALRSVADLDHWDERSLVPLSISILLFTSPEPLLWPKPQFKATLAGLGIGLEVLTVGAAARTFNLLLSDSRPVGLMILLP